MSRTKSLCKFAFVFISSVIILFALSRKNDYLQLIQVSVAKALDVAGHSVSTDRTNLGSVHDATVMSIQVSSQWTSVNMSASSFSAENVIEYSTLSTNVKT